MKVSNRVAVALAACLSACSSQPRISDVVPVQQNLGHTPNTQEADAAAAGRRADSVRNAVSGPASDYMANALSGCTPEICAAIGRLELAIGMTHDGVYAVTGTVPDAWTRRGTDAAGMMTPSARTIRDRVNEIAMVTFRDSRLVSYTYREGPTGMRTVASKEDATQDGRRRAQAQALLDRGDEEVTRGNSSEALARYDEADVLDPNNPGTTLRIAKLLDKQLRPVEALMRYQKFLHEMDIDRINAQGKANAELAGAVVAAQARVVQLVETTNKKP